MSRFLFLFVSFILTIDSFDTVRIIGLFLRHQNASSDYLRSSSSGHWKIQSIAMFRAAIVLADRYKIYVKDRPINYTILQATTDGNGFAALELLCQSITDKTEQDVVGIVGPTSSTNARFLGPFAAHIELPLISYAATNAELDDIFTYETFYRTVPSDILLAEAIVQLFKYFSWTTCTMILGKDDYGYGGLKILSEVYYSELSIEERLIFDPRFDKFHANLKQTLEKSRSRIVLVWANESSTTRIVQHALDAKLLTESYVWLMTDKIDINTFKRSDWPKLEGILAVVPVIDNERASGINETLQKEAFDIWRNSPKDKDSFPEDLSTVSPYAMYTFDAAWALIQALNKSSFDKNSPSMEQSPHCFDSLLKNYSNYHMYLKSTRFSGVSGIIQFSKNNSNDRVDGASYGLYNMQQKQQKNNITKRKLGYKQVMTWYETSRSWKSSTGEDTINIIWPGGEFEKVPTDYPQLRGQHLRIVVIEAPPFVIVRNISTHAQSGNNHNNPQKVNFRSDPLTTKNPSIVIYGFIADFIRELQARMHFNYTIDVADLTTNYHSLVASVAGDNRQYDIALSDIRITSGRLLIVDFSTPFHENTFRIITRKNPYSSSFSLFSCFNPFTWDVWAAIFAVIIYSCFIIYLFERQNPEIQDGESGIKFIFIGICKIFGSVIMMTGNITLTTNASRLTVLGLYSLYIILVATYTANLSSFLTLNRVQPSISGIDDIKNGRLPFSRIGIVSNSAASDYYMQNISSMYYPLSTAEEIYLRLLDYTIDASLWDSYIVEYAVNNYYCDKLSVVGVGFLKSSYGIVLPKDWPYKIDLDVHIMAMRESEKLEKLENRWLEHRTCSSSSSSSSGEIDQANGSKNQIFSLDAIGGLFLTFLILTAIAFILHLWNFRVAIKNTFWQTIDRIKLHIKRPITRQ